MNGRGIVDSVTEEADIAKLRASGCDAVWLGAVGYLYPDGFATTISVSGIGERWEGEHRPGHFDGVATIVAKLFIAVMPDAAVFGQKDWQQLAVIKRMTGDLGLPIAAYVLGDAALVAPVLLMQLLVLQPLALTLLDVDASNGAGRPGLSIRAALLRPVKNPITIGSAIGLLLAVTDVELPSAVHDPLALLGGMAVPAMLLAYGVSLRLGPLPGRGVAFGIRAYF